MASAMNQPKEKPCRCEGMNERCLHCFGTGYVMVGAPTQAGLGTVGNPQKKRRWSRARKAIGKSDASLGPWDAKRLRTDELNQLATHSMVASVVYCRICQRPFADEQARETHFQEQHLLRSKAGENSALPTVLRRRTRQRRPQNVVQGKDVQGGDIKANGKERELVPCPQCAAMVRSSKLERHIAKVHASERPKQTGNGVPRKGSSGRDQVGAQSPPPAKQDTGRQMDGSRDYWRIRERGRFGSHPSFDAMDDDSGPG